MWRRQSSEISLRKMIRICLLLCMAVLSVARCNKIHHHMTAEELLAVFHTTDHETVPAYEVVPIVHSAHKRSPEIEPEVHLKAFGKNFNLSLKPTEGLLSSGKHISMWTVSRNNSSPNGLYYEEVPEGSADIGDIYQDPSNMASILLHRDASGKVLVEGNIESDYVIRPLPERILTDVIDKTEAFHESHLLPNVTRTKRSLSQTHHHVVYKRITKPSDDKYSDFAFMEPDHLAKRFRSKRSINSRAKREAPYVIYPEILCIVDYDGYRLHSGDNVQIKRYFVSFWNGVDLRYKLLKGPKVRISIAGIIISRARDATPYLESNRVGRDAIDSAAALTDMGKYLFRERRLPVYDIAVAVTKLDMCRRQYTHDVCNRGTAGFAYVGGACVVNKRLEKVNSVAIIEDTGGFSGIIVAAHEVGHLLGAVHDGSPPPSYLGGPGAEKCRWEDGYIMSDLRHTEKGFKWSHCSISSFHHFLNGDTATCLHNEPHEDEALPRVLPGKLLSLDAQCRKDRGTSACFKDDRVCAQLFCFDAGSGYCVAYRPAAEGSPCGDGQYCLNGKCVAEHENIIPDYTQNIPTYVRRDSIYNPGLRPNLAPYNNTEYRYPWESTTQYTPQKNNEYSTAYYAVGNKYPTVPVNELSYNHNQMPYQTTPMYYNNDLSYSYSTTQSKPVYQQPYYKNYNQYYNYDKTSKRYNNHFNNIIDVNNNYNNQNFNQNYNQNYNKYNNNQYYNQNRYYNEITSTTPETTTTTLARKKLIHFYNYYFNEQTTTINPITPYYYENMLSNEVNPYNYKSSITASTATEDQNRRQYTGRGTEDGECIDTATNCAELIDRLRTWLCHLQSVKIRCCASLKALCS